MRLSEKIILLQCSRQSDFSLVDGDDFHEKNHQIETRVNSFNTRWVRLLPSTVLTLNKTSGRTFFGATSRNGTL